MCIFECSGYLIITSFVVFAGIKGWFSLFRPINQQKSRSKRPIDSDDLDNTAGGLELMIKFANSSDRELVINVARGIGWSPIQSLDVFEDSFQDAMTLEYRALTAILVIEQLWISKEMVCNLFKEPCEKWTSYRMYCRYKFYDKSEFFYILSTRASHSQLSSKDR